MSIIKVPFRFVDESGNVSNSNTNKNIIVSGITELSDSCFNSAWSYVSCNKVSFPDLISTGQYGLGYAFRNAGNINTASFPKLTTIGDYGLTHIFDQARISNAEFPKLTTVGVYGLAYAFNYAFLIKSIKFPELTTAVGPRALDSTFEGARIEIVEFPKLSIFKEPTDYILHNLFRENVNIKQVNFGGITTTQFENLVTANSNFASAMFNKNSSRDADNLEIHFKAGGPNSLSSSVISNIGLDTITVPFKIISDL